jgi:exonuclease III
MMDVCVCLRVCVCVCVCACVCVSVYCAHAQVWAGDLNVAHLDCDVHNPKANRNRTPGFCDAERANFDKVLASGLRDVWREAHPAPATGYTYYSKRFNAKAEGKGACGGGGGAVPHERTSRARACRGAGWRLDYILVSAALAPAVTETFLLEGVEGSDHLPVGVTLDLAALSDGR